MQRGCRHWGPVSCNLDAELTGSSQLLPLSLILSLSLRIGNLLGETAGWGLGGVYTHSSTEGPLPLKASSVYSRQDPLRGQDHFFKVKLQSELNSILICLRR